MEITEDSSSLKEKNVAFIGCYTRQMGHIKGDSVGEGIYTFSLTNGGRPIFVIFGFP